MYSLLRIVSFSLDTVQYSYDQHCTYVNSAGGCGCGVQGNKVRRITPTQSQYRHGRRNRSWGSGRN